MNSQNFVRSLELILGAMRHGIFILLLAMNTASSQSLPINMPAKPFGELPHPPAPNYADERHWAALPNRLDAADVIPENDLFGDRQESALVDAFISTQRPIAELQAGISRSTTKAPTNGPMNR